MRQRSTVAICMLLMLVCGCDTRDRSSVKAPATQATAQTTHYRRQEPWSQQNAKLTQRLANALNGNKPEVLEQALAEGANPNVTLMDGTTMLHAAVGMGQLECVRILLRHGADPTIADGRGRTALHNATYYDVRTPELITLLLDAGAKVELKDLAGKTALDYAVESGDGGCEGVLRKAIIKGQQ